MEKLYIENFSNTEFVYEKDIYAYLVKLKRLLEKYNSSVVTKGEKEKYDPWGLLQLWQLHICSGNYFARGLSDKSAENKIDEL